MVADPERIMLNCEDLGRLPEDHNRYEPHDGGSEVTAAPTPRRRWAAGRRFALRHRHSCEPGLSTALIVPAAVRLSEMAVIEPDLLFLWLIDAVIETIEALQLTGGSHRSVAFVGDGGSDSAPPLSELKISRHEIFAPVA